LLKEFTSGSRIQVAQAQSLKGFIEKLFRILRYDVLATS